MISDVVEQPSLFDTVREKIYFPSSVGVKTGLEQVVQLSPAKPRIVEAQE